MDKRTIYYSMGFAAVLVVALGTLNFNTDTQLLRGTVGINQVEDIASDELSDDIILCDTSNNLLAKLYKNGSAKDVSGMQLEYLGFEISEEESPVLESILIAVNDSTITLDINDSYSGLTNMPLVVGDNISYSGGFISFNIPAGDNEISLHVRYVDENELVIEINQIASCLPINSTVVMIPCDDCKVRTSLSQQDYWLMLNDSKLKISNENFVGSTLDSDEFEGLDLSELDIYSEFEPVDLDTEFETQIALSGSDSLNRTFVYLKN